MIHVICITHVDDTLKLKLYHKVDAKHARNIGEESISNAVQAVTELV